MSRVVSSNKPSLSTHKSQIFLELPCACVKGRQRMLSLK